MIAYFIDKHVFLLRGEEEDEEDEEDEDEEEEEEEKHSLLAQKRFHDRLAGLSEIQEKPRMSLKRAVIMSSNEICRDCDRFKERVNDYLGLNIEMSWRT